MSYEHKGSLLIQPLGPRFPENFGDTSEEQGQRFHQDIKTMEDRYQGRWDIHMMADYWWNL